MYICVDVFKCIYVYLQMYFLFVMILSYIYILIRNALQSDIL